MLGKRGNRYRLREKHLRAIIGCEPLMMARRGFQTRLKQTLRTKQIEMQLDQPLMGLLLLIPGNLEA